MTITFGTDGRDVLATQGDGDTVLGFGGKDLLASHFNATTLIGGAGDDSLATTGHYAGQEDSGLTAVQEGGSGDDAISVDLASSVTKPEEASSARSTATAVVDAGDGADQIAVAAAAKFDGPTPYYSPNWLVEAIASIDAGDGPDQVVCELHAFDGLITPSAQLALFMGGGADVANASVSSESYSSCRTSITFQAGDGNDRCTLGGGAYSYDDGGSLELAISGEAGDDVLQVSGFASGSHEAGEITGLVDGGLGDDQITLNLITFYYDVHASGGAGNDEIEARFAVPTGGAIVLDGGAGDDTVRYTGNGAVATGGSGNDTLDASYDEYGFYPATQRLSGGPGDDFITSSVSEGRSILSGGAGNDFIVVSGGERNLVRGGAGDDWLEAGGGRDIFVYQGTGFGDDRITGFQDAGADRIKLIGSGATDMTQLTIIQDGENTVISGLGDSSITLQSFEAKTLDNHDFIFA
jgi:Ca2+-binding RTX toxin-like protein